MQDHVHDEGVRVKVTADDYPLLRIWTRGLHMQRQQVAYRVIETPMYAMVSASRASIVCKLLPKRVLLRTGVCCGAGEVAVGTRRHIPQGV